MNYQNAQESLSSFKDIFLIIGYKPDGVRGIPVSYKWVTETAIDENDVCEKTKGMTEFKVFLIGHEPLSFPEWINLRISKSQEATEKEEKALYEQLKSKFEPK